MGALFAIAGGSVLLGAAGREAEALLPLTGTSAGIASAAVALAIPILLASRRTRPLAWLAGLALLAPGLPSAAVLGPLSAWLLLFEPAWIPPARASGPDSVFYDGACGFCQRSIRVLLAEDRSGDTFRLAPRASAAFAAALPAEMRVGLPPSIVVVDADGRVHLRSRATIRLLVRLGGAWRAIGGLIAVVPGPLRDLGYRAIAAVRHRLAPPPERACPLLPPELRARFLPGAEEEVVA
jgi:predicted DCC family thiol-disulfide oxidoreductase YuxK